MIEYKESSIARQARKVFCTMCKCLALPDSCRLTQASTGPMDTEVDRELCLEPCASLLYTTFAESHHQAPSQSTGLGQDASVLARCLITPRMA